MPAAPIAGLGARMLLSGYASKPAESEPVHPAWFTLRNSNDYAVNDIEISCTFARRDGSHLTDRRRVIHDVVNKKSRKTFVHVGFVNIYAAKAKCSLAAASHI